MFNSRHCNNMETQIGRGGDEAKVIAQRINYTLSSLSAFKSGITHTHIPDNTIPCSSPSTRLYV